MAEDNKKELSCSSTPTSESQGETWMLLAASVPPELFDGILFYVHVDRVRSSDYSAQYIKKYGPIDTLADVKACSLVCRFWANRCRRRMFSRKTLRIESYGHAELFRRYVVEGSARLVHLYKLIREIKVQQNYVDKESFLHLLYLPVIQKKLVMLKIIGPVPTNLHHARLDTPHWSVAPANAILPISFLRTPITVSQVHLPSFYHATKYIRHFTWAARVNFGNVTWDAGGLSTSQPRASPAQLSRRRRPHSMGITAQGCTDSVRLALTAAMLNPQCPLHRVSDVEREWVNTFMTLLWAGKNNPYVSMGFRDSENEKTMHVDEFYFLFDKAQTTDDGPSSLSLVGIHAYIHTPKFPASVNFHALIAHVRTCPAIRAVVLLVSTRDVLQAVMQPYHAGRTLDPPLTPFEHFKFVLAYKDEERDRAVGVHPATLRHDGRVWVNLPKGFSRDKSLHILQRQLRRN